MKKTALVLTLSIALFSTTVICQTVSNANANPNWQPWLSKIIFPTINVESPIESESYPSNDIWLKFTVAKPSDWLYRTDCQIILVAYCVDGTANGYGWSSDNSDENETIIEVQDPMGVVNPPTSFSFSFNLEGLTDGQHTLEIFVEGNYDGTGFGHTYPRISFTVYTPFPTTLVIASIASVAVIGVGLQVYFRKRNH